MCLLACMIPFDLPEHVHRQDRKKCPEFLRTWNGNQSHLLRVFFRCSRLRLEIKKNKLHKIEAFKRSLPAGIWWRRQPVCIKVQ